MNEQFKEQITYMAREFATAYTNRHFPNEPAFAFGHEGWEKFVVALAALSHPKSIEADSGVIAAPVDHVNAAVEMVAGAHPDKGTSALAAPVVPAPGACAWMPIDTMPRDQGSYLVADAARGLVAPHIRGVIHNNPGTTWDWQYGEAITHWMPLPPAPGAQAAPVAQLSEPPASAALMRILKIVQDYVPPDGTPIEEAMSQIIACVDPWPDTGFTQFDDLLDDAAEWSGYVEVDTAPYGLKRHLKEVFEKYGITAAAPTTPKDSE